MAFGEWIEVLEPDAVIAFEEEASTMTGVELSDRIATLKDLFPFETTEAELSKKAEEHLIFAREQFNRLDGNGKVRKLVASALARIG